MPGGCAQVHSALLRVAWSSSLTLPRGLHDFAAIHDFAATTDSSRTCSAA
jgi:hypothetical protein